MSAASPQPAANRRISPVTEANRQAEEARRIARANRRRLRRMRFVSA